MTGGKSIWFFAVVFTIAFSTVMGTMNTLRMQDLGRSTKESATAHVQAENFALDALDNNLEYKHKHMGIAVIKDEDIPKVIEYVEDKVAAFDALKSDMEDLEIINPYVYPGKYGMVSSEILGEKTPLQLFGETPYYQATIRGKIKRVVRSVRDTPYIEFEQDVFVRASHITRLKE